MGWGGEDEDHILFLDLGGGYFILFYFQKMELYICIFKKLFFWLRWVFVASSFSSCGERGPLFVVVCGLLIAVASLVAEHGLQARASVVVACGFQQLWHAGSVVVACRLQSAGSVVVAMGLVALWHVGSSRTRARTCVLCIGRWTLQIGRAHV